MTNKKWTKEFLYLFTLFFVQLLHGQLSEETIEKTKERIYKTNLYNYVDYFDTNTYLVYSYTKKFGFVDSNGTILLPCEYKNIDPISEHTNMWCTWKGNKKGLFDLKLQKLVLEAEKYESIKYKDSFLIMKHADKIDIFSLLNSKVIIENATFYRIFKNTIFYLNNQGYGFISKTGQNRLNQKIDKIKDLGGDFEIYSGDKKGIIANGKLVVNFAYNLSDTIVFHQFLGNTRSMIKVNSQYQIMDSLGNPIFKESYANISPINFSGIYNCQYQIKIGNNTAIIKENGTTLLPLDDILYIPKHKNFEGIAYYYVKKDNKWGMIDLQGNKIIPIEYDKIEYQYDYNSMNLAYKQDTLRVIDDNGKIILNYKQNIPLTFSHFKLDDSITILAVNRFICKNFQGKYGAIDSLGKIIIPFEYDEYELGFIMWNKTFYFVTSTYTKHISGSKIRKHVGLVDKDGKLLLPTIYKEMNMLWGDNKCISNEVLLLDSNEKVSIFDLQTKKNKEFKGKVWPRPDGFPSYEHKDSAMIFDCNYNPIINSHYKSHSSIGYWNMMTVSHKQKANRHYVGFHNYKLNKTIGFIYDSISSSRFEQYKPFIFVRDSFGKSYYLDTNLNQWSIAKIDSMYPVPKEKKFHSKHYKIFKDGNTYGIKDTNNNIVFTEDNLEVTDFYDDRFLKLERNFDDYSIRKSQYSIYDLKNKKKIFPLRDGEEILFSDGKIYLYDYKIIDRFYKGEKFTLIYNIDGDLLEKFEPEKEKGNE